MHQIISKIYASAVYLLNRNAYICIFLLICYKKQAPEVQLIKKKPYICGNQQTKEDLLMSTKNEIKNENPKTNDKIIESSAPKQMPSIWYT